MTFTQIHKVGKVGIFILPKSEKKIDTEINLFNLRSKHHDKYKFPLKLIVLLTVYNSFPLEVVQKYQHYQLYVLGENSVAGEPNDHDGTANCAEVYVGSGMWNDHKCKELQLGTICKLRRKSTAARGGVIFNKSELPFAFECNLPNSNSVVNKFL